MWGIVIVLITIYATFTLYYFDDQFLLLYDFCYCMMYRFDSKYDLCDAHSNFNKTHQCEALKIKVTDVIIIGKDLYLLPSIFE